MSAHSEIPAHIPFRTLERISGRTLAVLALLVLVGAAAAIGVGAPDAGRVWTALLFNWLFWSALALGMVMFAVALQLSNARWAWSIRRFALGGVAFLPISFLLLVVVFFGSEVYFHHWLHVEGDPVIDAKRAWLNLPGMITRDFAAVLVLYGLASAFAYFSLRPDLHGVGDDRQRGVYERLTRGWRSPREEAGRSERTLMPLGVAMGILYAFLWSVVAIDLAMSLSPHWFSTMFPVAFFWTGFHGGVAFTALAVALLRKQLGIEKFVTVRQFHDLGKLVFAFSVFWMYLNWSQYVVIWYGLLPWEQDFFVQRFSEPYKALAMAVPVLVFVLPFFGLLTRPPKMVPGILAGFAGLILLGHWLERFLLIYPSLLQGEEMALPLGFTEIGMGLGFLGLFLASYLWFLRTFPVLPSPATLGAAEPALVTVSTRREA
ncbi:MAG: hypothetical protein M3483_02135 [Gemmatimonadota bacterium]|nr:hypothetical protein [Gemmatimonadota bacterium]